MELRHLRYVVAVADELNFSRAAKRLNVSQPPLSHQIRQLEDEIGAKIFYRTKREVALTEVGQRFVSHARRILALTDQASEMASRTTYAEVADLTIGTETAEKQVILDALAAFGKRHKEAHVEMRFLRTTDQIQALYEGRIDVGFVFMPVDEPALAFETVSREPLMLALPEKHRLAAKQRISLRALTAENSIRFPRPLSQGYYEHISTFCRNEGFHLNIVPEIDNTFTALALVGAGLAVSFVPSCMQHDRKRKGIVYREIQAPLPKVECAIAYRRDDSSLVVQSFLNLVRQITKVNGARVN